jgi:hypothetical protein
VALFENIQRAAIRAQLAGQEATEVFMSGLTQHHLSNELTRHPSLFTMRNKPKSVWPSEMERRLPTEITVGTKSGTLRLKIRIRESVPTDSFNLEFKKLVKRIDYKTGREEYVPEQS